MPFPTTSENIARAEQALGRALPDVLRERLLRNNGGDLTVGDDDGWQLHPLWDESNRRTIARTTSHVVHETTEAQRWSRFPRGAVAVANNGCGDLLVLRAGSDQFEFWDHETGACEPATVDWR